MAGRNNEKGMDAPMGDRVRVWAAESKMLRGKTVRLPSNTPARPKPGRIEEN